MEESTTEGDRPFLLLPPAIRQVRKESRSLDVERKIGGNFHLKLNTHPSSIVYKYREGKVKRTLKRELKVPETTKNEAKEVSC